MKVRTLAVTGAAVAGVAVAGSLASAPNSRWYRRLKKPSWQPPRWAFGAVWTPLYGLIAYGGARALDRSDADGRPALARAYTLNLLLNGAWTPLFFQARSPRLALADVVALNLSNLVLLVRARRADPRAAALLLPYAAWTVYATALNAAIVRRNRGG